MRKALLKYLSIALLAFIGLSPLGNLLGQQPAYFILGEEEFKGLQIYDVIQDSRKNYLFSTNEGIYLYDYQRFEKIGCPEAKSNSVFNFAANRTGTIFCCNLNHQIFSIRDRQCSLLYELKDDEVSSNVSLAIGPNDELIAGSKKIIRIDANGKVLHRFFYNSTYWGLPFHLKNGDVIYSLPGTDSVLVIGSDQLTFRRLRGPSGQGKPNGVLSFLRVADQGYAVDLESKALFAFDEEDFRLRPLPGNPAFERSKSLRIYPVGDNTWTAGTLPGAFCLNSNLESGKYPLFYENYFISDIFQDHEGNILLSTFDNGVLVVPDLSIPDAINSFRDDPITAIHVDQETGTLYLGSSKGQLMQYSDHQLKTLHDSGMRAIETMVDKPGFPYLLYDNGSILALDKRTGESQNLSYTALKDAVIIDAQTVYLGTNVSLIKCTWDARGNTTTTSLPGFNFRIHMLEFEKASRSLIASTSHGLFRIDSLEKSEKILLDGKDIFPTAMTAFNENVIAATQNDGILVLNHGKVVSRIWPKHGELENLRKLHVDNNTLLAKSSHALYQFGMDGSVLQNISKVYGFPEKRIFDFDLQDSLIWVSHAGGVQAVELTLSSKSQSLPDLQIAQVAVNDKPVDPAKAGSFPSDQRKVQFALALPSLRHKESIRFHYQLKGYDPDWLTKPNDGNNIVYNALAPGNYTFVAKVETQGQFSGIVSYPFEIASPFYARWWFIAAAGLALAGLLFLIFKRQLNIQRRKARQINELNASKLTAIQSQMNPHFIFNALNSIQDLVLKGDIENSYSYITTFSNLVRSTLNFSDKDFIDFDQELKLLNLYLSLEQLRFKKSLSYTIEAQDMDDIQLPPLLIQPFVENALVHGLLHKEGEKRLTIRFELRETLICIIQDNGIGRERSKAIKERQRSDHESFSGKAIRKRFDILSDVFQGEFGYHYEDLVEDGKALGTRITLTIPVKRNF